MNYIAPPPTIAQLKTGEWVVANMQGTDLWERTFSSRRDAARALLDHYVTQRVVKMNREMFT